MVRLEEALQEHLKPALARPEKLGQSAEDLRSHAEIVSAIGEVLLQPGMDEAEEDSYREFAMAMRDSAKGIVDAVRREKPFGHDSTCQRGRAVLQRLSR